MKFLQHLTMTKSLSLAKFELKWHHHVSASSKSPFWTRFGSCKATTLNLDPNPLKVTRVKVLITLNLPDKSFASKPLPVDQQCLVKFTEVNFRCYLPFNHITFNQTTTAVATSPRRTSPQTLFGWSHYKKIKFRDDTCLS